MAPVSDTAEATRFSFRHIAFFTPLIILHAACALLFFVGTSTAAIAAFAITAVLQIFGITAGYHRLLSHRAFRTTRFFQFILTLLGVLAAQNGPLWWVGHHRHHHKHADGEGDVHSPRANFFWSHMGWLFSTKCLQVRTHLVADLARLAEMRFLEKHYYLVVLGYAALLYGAGEIWWHMDPGASVDGLQLVVWGSIASTVFAYHAIWSANSVCHRFGTRRFPTQDESRNNLLVTLLTLGDGWHHNHHYCPYSARHGFRWWEIDINYGILRLLERLGLVWGLRLPPKRVYS
jgi:stearoyl-CoA desaturase (delta-9 desaturase)